VPVQQCPLRQRSGPPQWLALQWLDRGWLGQAGWGLQQQWPGLQEPVRQGCGPGDLQWCPMCAQPRPGPARQGQTHKPVALQQSAGMALQWRSALGPGVPQEPVGQPRWAVQALWPPVLQGQGSQWQWHSTVLQELAQAAWCSKQTVPSLLGLAWPWLQGPATAQQVLRPVWWWLGCHWFALHWQVGEVAEAQGADKRHGSPCSKRAVHWSQPGPAD